MSCPAFIQRSLQMTGCGFDSFPLFPQISLNPAMNLSSDVLSWFLKTGLKMKDDILCPLFFFFFLLYSDKQWTINNTLKKSGWIITKKAINITRNQNTGGKDVRVQEPRVCLCVCVSICSCMCVGIHVHPIVFVCALQIVTGTAMGEHLACKLFTEKKRKTKVPQKLSKVFKSFHFFHPPQWNEKQLLQFTISKY